MSLSVDGVWKAGVWATTVWASGVWSEGAAAIVQRGGTSSKWKKKQKKWKRIPLRNLDEALPYVPPEPIPVPFPLAEIALEDEDDEILLMALTRIMQ